MKTLFLAVSMAMVLSSAAFANCKECEHAKEGEKCVCPEGHEMHKGHKKGHGEKKAEKAEAAPAAAEAPATH